MLICNSTDIKSIQSSVIALGCFDGIHLGHMAVIGRAKEQADACNLPLVALTFEEPPRNFFSATRIPTISTLEEKLALLEKVGVDVAVCLPLNKEIFSISPEDFIRDILIDALHASKIVCGYNYTFGKNASGNTAQLQKLCDSEKIELSVVPPLMYNGVAVSSSLIRSAVEKGDMEYAAKLLGRPFSMTETVINGQHLARTLGFPTVNTIPASGRLIPLHGVYVTKIHFKNQEKYGITNVGIRPTVNTNILCAETHIFDFDGNLYKEKITVEFLHFLREERRFNSVEQMSAQVNNDIQEAKKFLSL